MTLEAKDVCVRLKSREVLKGVSLSVEPGEIVAVVGPNGAGKSTFLKSLAGLLAPSAGSVLLDGRHLRDWDRQALGRRIAYLPQDRIVHWPLSVRRVVALGRLPHLSWPASPGRVDEEAVAAALAAMDVMAFADRTVAELSGGERARVLVARALAQQAPILIADEPTAGLDPAHSLSLFTHLARLAREGRTVIVALHDLSLAARFCHRVVLLKAGTLLAAGPARDVISPERLAAAFDVKATIGEVAGVPVVLALETLT